MNYDIYLVGVGGQGVLTIGEILTEAAVSREIPVSFYPTKGMAQRGGHVKGRVRIGRQITGPNVAEKSADLVIATELSEALKAVRFLKPGGDFVLYAHVWAPTAVMLGKEPYPALEQVMEEISKAGGRVHYLDPGKLPKYEGTPVPDNVFVLGAAFGHTQLGQILQPSDAVQAMKARWKRGVERNLFAFQAGLEAPADSRIREGAAERR
jgi:indolepyruvate ferredoxin oxidoreductase beta subunit